MPFMFVWHVPNRQYGRETTIHIHVYTHIYIYVCTYYIHIYIYTHAYTYIHVYCAHTCKEKAGLAHTFTDAPLAPHACGRTANELRWVKRQLDLLDAGDYWHVYAATCGIEYSSQSRNTSARGSIGDSSSRAVTVDKLRKKYQHMTAAFDRQHGPGSERTLFDPRRPVGLAAVPPLEVGPNGHLPCVPPAHVGELRSTVALPAPLHTSGGCGPVNARPP